MTLPWTEAPRHALPAALPDATAAGVYWQANDAALLLEAPGVARYMARAGELVFAPLAAADDATVKLYGAGLPVAAAWVQRGYLALHAAAVATPAGAVVIAGASAAGKSVLAAALAARGCALLADEVTPVALDAPGGPAVLPQSDGALLLWPDAVAALGLAPERCAALRPGLGRCAVGGYAVAPAAPLRAVYLLAAHNGADIQATPLTGRARVLAVLAAAFNRFLPQPPALRQQLFLQLSAQPGRALVQRLLRPRVGWSADALAAHVLEDLAQ